MRNLILLCAVVAAASGFTAAKARPDLAEANTVMDKTAHPITEAFKAYRPNSRVRIDHEPWDAFLAKAVLDVGPAERLYVRPPALVTGSNIQRTDRNRLRYEGNRVYFSKFKDDHKAYIKDYIADLVEIANTRGLADLSRNEQLAFWLNLYNASVIDHLADQYPVRRVGTIRQELFASKRHTIQGMALSLDDIRLRILQPLWQDPRVIYGLFQGFRSGPDIRGDAYTAKTVWAKLEENSKAFVRSFRGVQFWTLKTKISAHYKENAGFFKDFDADIRDHLEQRMTDAMRAKFNRKKRISPSIRYEVIADTRGGYKGVLSAGTQAVQIQNPRNPLMPFEFNVGTDDEAALLTYLIKKKIRQRQAVVSVEEIEFDERDEPVEDESDTEKKDK